MFTIGYLLKVFFVSLCAISVSSETITAGTFYDVSFESGDAEIPSLEQLTVLNECEAQSSCIHVVKLKKTGELKKISSAKELEELRNKGDVDGFMTKTPSKSKWNEYTGCFVQSFHFVGFLAINYKLYLMNTMKVDPPIMGMRKQKGLCPMP
eukprot:gene7198-12868_t